MLREAALAGLLVGFAAGTAAAQSPSVRLAAPVDCPRNANCIPGLKRVYHLDPTSVFVPLKVADVGVQALDDGAAEVAVAFSSNPQLSRPDIVTLGDDRGMVTSDHVVPVVRRSVLRRYGAPLRRRLDTASALLSTLELRGLNQEVIDGRLPEPVGGEFADANGLGGPSRRRAGPPIVIGYQNFAENQTLAFLYAEALRGAGFRVRVRAAGGLRPQTIAALRRGRIDMWPGYSGSLLGFLHGRSLPRALARIGAVPMRLAPAEDRNTFVMKRDVAQQLGVSKLSDLARYWPAAGAARAAAADAPADPLLSEQWAFAPDSVLNIPAAGQLTEGAGVTVAVIDSGVDVTHSDLAPNVWTNFGEIPGNGIDDDHNGYVDDVHGVDLTSPSAGQDLSDGFNHGTHVAGIIAAAQNGHGVVGVAPQAKIMAIKVISNGGQGTSGAVVAGVRYAVANGARIINMSLGGDQPDPTLKEAIDAAAAANVLVIAAAGNAGRNIDDKPFYPGAFGAPNMVTVASTDPNKGLGISDFSDYGRLAVQVAAPGSDILSTSSDGGFVYMSGTSMATPMVTGVAALMASANPRLGAADLRALLMETASRSQLPVTSGYVDALRAVVAASSAVASATGQQASLKVLAATRSRQRIRIQAAALGSVAAIRHFRVVLDGRTVAQLGAVPSPFTVSLRKPGSRVRVEALDAAGKVIASGQRRVVKLRSGKRGAFSGSPISG